MSRRIVPDRRRPYLGGQLVRAVFGLIGMAMVASRPKEPGAWAAVVQLLIGAVAFPVTDWRRKGRLDCLLSETRPDCFCPYCSAMVDITPHKPECRGDVNVNGRLPKRCPGCQPAPSTREEVRNRRMSYYCEGWIHHQFHTVPEDHPLRKGLWATWVVGTLRPEDFAHFAGLPHALEWKCVGVRLLHIPPVSHGGVGLCVLDLATLPEVSTLSEKHPVALLQAVWLGRSVTTLEVSQCLDRFDRATGFAAWERSRVRLLLEEEAPAPELLQRLKGRLGEAEAAVDPLRMLARLSPQPLLQEGQAFQARPCSPEPLDMALLGTGREEP